MMRLVFRNKLPIFSDLAGPYKVEYGSTTHVCKVGFQRQCQQVRQGGPPSHSHIVKVSFDIVPESGRDLRLNAKTIECSIF